MFDVAVIGAGPAGAWTAFLLARQGVGVGLFDGSHPREKPCGGGLTARTLALVAPAIDSSRLRRVPITTAHFLDGERRPPVAVALPRRPGAAAAADPLVIVSRREFDGALLAAAEAAGTTFIARRVTSIAAAAGGGGPFVLSTGSGTYHAATLIGADGANSLVRRSLARPFPRAHLSLATGFYAPGVTGAEILLEFAAAPPGYLWSFPRPDHLAIGICAQADAGTTAAMLRDRVASWIHETGLAGRHALMPYSWPIPSLPASGWRDPMVGGPRWLLVGDAAGLVDPITREGIFFALRSGSLAADALHADPTDPLPAYRAALAAHVVPELRRAAELKAGFFRPRFVRLALEALARSAAIRAVMADLIVGAQPYCGLEWRLLGTREFDLAWQLLSDRWRDSRRGRARAPAGD